jgi:hypothetical protein
MGAPSPHDGARGYETPIVLHETAEFDATPAPNPDGAAAVGNFSRCERLHPLTEFDCSQGVSTRRNHLVNPEFQNGSGRTTQIGYVNRNNQRCGGHRGVAGSDHGSLAYRMECLEPGCGQVYGANGTDVFQRKCPRCQGGKPGVEF